MVSFTTSTVEPAGAEPVPAGAEEDATSAEVGPALVEAVWTVAFPDSMAEASPCAPAFPPACADEAMSDEVALATELDDAEEPPEQLKSYKGLVLNGFPTMPKLGLGVVGTSS